MTSKNVVHALSGKRFGSMVVIDQVGSDNGAVMMCGCDCGSLFLRKSSVISRGEKLGRNQSCGCSPEYREVFINGTRTCPLCKETKKINKFSKSRGTTYGVQVTCKNCHNEWRTKNKERLDRYRDEYYENNKERLQEKNKEYASKNKEKTAAASRRWRLRHPEKRRLVAMAYVKNNPEKMAALSAAKRSKKLQATPAWADELEMLKFYTEAKEITKNTGIKHHVDHIVPLVSKLVCGLHCQQNLMVIDGKENIRKGNRYWPDMPEIIN